MSAEGPVATGYADALGRVKATALTQSHWRELAVARCAGTNTGKNCGHVVARVVDVRGAALYYALALDSMQTRGWVRLKKLAALSGGSAPRRVPDQVNEVYDLLSWPGRAHEDDLEAFCRDHGRVTVNRVALTQEAGFLRRRLAPGTVHAVPHSAGLD